MASCAFVVALKHAPEILRLAQKTLDALHELVEAQRIARDEAGATNYLFRDAASVSLVDVEFALLAIESQAENVLY